MTQEREYIIVLKSHEDLDQFYDDMESSYGDNEIPNRHVECADRRPMSRSTHYYLTDHEAEQVAADSRVESITLTYIDRGLEIRPMTITTQTGSNWNKSSTNNAADVNWGLLRGYEKATRANWGSDSTVSVTGTIQLTNIGRNVDVVISDGHLVENHPEWAVNADGTGGTRLNRLNWFNYNPQVTGGGAGTYVYDFISSTQANADNNHGNNVGAIVTGNTCGWARGANIYNISPYSTTANNTGNYIYNLFNYVRAWHAAKSLNPTTGKRNPTIINCSWGLNGSIPLSSIDAVGYQGVEYARPGSGWAALDRAYFGLVVMDGSNNIFWMGRDASIDADITDCINDGIIVVGAAGNFYMYQDSPNGINYNNYLRSGASYNYYMRGASPSAATGSICVGAIDSTVQERKVDFSNTGPRIDIFAPGNNIMGAYYTGGVGDPRNASYQKGKMSGTSQASPQVCGLLACALEVYPTMTPTEAANYIQGYSQAALANADAASTAYGTLNYLNYNNLNNAPNRYAIYKSERGISNQVYPKNDFKVRPTSGRVFPRQRIRRTG